MPVSKALESSAKAFSKKYSCNFDFTTFESRVEEFTFLRPNGGWIDVYRAVFGRIYKNTLEKVALGKVDNLDGEAMLDDFEYTLIRPYANENKADIKHKPYVGMDRLARLEYLDKLTLEAPSNPVELYTEKYKSGELSIGQMKSALGAADSERTYYIMIAGYVQALENANSSRRFIWRATHPFRNSAEKREAALMKKHFIDEMNGDESAYVEFARAACETFEGHKRVNESLSLNRAHAIEELNRKNRMKEAMRESFGMGVFETNN